MDIRDLFRPKWKHSEKAVRLKALTELKSNDVESLLEIVRTDEAEDVRAAAAAMIDDLERLRTLQAESPGAQVQAVIRQKLDGAAFRQALHADDAAERLRQMRSIQDERLLAELILETADVELRLVTLERIEVEELLVHIATRKCGKDVGCAAVARISGREHLEKVSNSGSNKNVRRVAAARLQELFPPPGPDPEELRQEELAELYRHSRELKDSWNFSAVAALLEADRKRWQELDPEGKHELFKPFQNVLSLFDERREKFEALQAVEKARLAAEEQEAETKESLCQAVAELDAQDEPFEKRLQALVEEWEKLDPLSSEANEKDLQKRFAAGRTQAESKRRQVLDESKRLAAIEQQAAVLEKLHDAEDWDKIQAALAETKTPVADLARPAAGPALERLEQARQVLLQRLEAHEKELAAVSEQRMKRLQQLLDEVRRLCETEDHQSARQRIHEIKDEWQECKGNDRDELRKSFKAALDTFYDHEREYRQEREWAEWHNKTEKEKLIAAVEACDQEQDLSRVAGMIKDAQAMWREIGPVPRQDSQAMWHRFHDACDRNFSRCRDFFETQRLEREASFEKALAYCQQAEAVQNSADWRQAAEQLKQLQTDWRELGPLPRSTGQRAYQRFRAACDCFFERQRQHFEELDAHREDNQKKKELIITRVEELIQSDDELHAGDCMDLQDEWKSVGPALQEEEPKLRVRFREVCDRFFQRLDAERQKNRDAKVLLCEQVEKMVAELADDGDRAAVAREIHAIQKQWRDIGPAPQGEEQQLWARFREPCDRFFEARRTQYQEMADERERHLAEKEDLVMEAEALAESSDWRDTAQLLKALQNRWKEIGPAPRENEKNVWDRFHAACDRFFERRRLFYESQDKKRLDNLKDKETLLSELELLVGTESPQARTSQGLTLAEEIELAIETNFVMASDSQSTFDEVRRIQERWKRIGPVPHEVNRQLWQRYRELLDKFYGERHDSR